MVQNSAPTGEITGHNASAILQEHDYHSEWRDKGWDSDRPDSRRNYRKGR